MEIAFTKMHGLGNDFVVIDAITQSISLSTAQIKFIANRNFGVGCDQILLVEKSDVADADFRYRIFNADGREVEQCGNGARCFATFVRDQGLTDKAEIPVITSNGRIVLKIEDDNQEQGMVTVDMGAPLITPAEIPFICDEQANSYTLDIDVNGEHQNISFSTLSMGNPHVVILVDNTEKAAVEDLGKAFQTDSHFPNSVNVGFMQILDRQNIRLRVYERSVGETQACGSGACAAVVAGINLGLLDETVEAQLLGGNLSIHWAGNQNPVMMTGPTATVFKGSIKL